MGLFDKVVSGMVKGLAKTVDAAAIPGLVLQYLAKTEVGDAAGLIARLQQGARPGGRVPGSGPAQICP